MTGVVAASTAGQAWPAACFVALACLLVAPANIVRSGLLAGIPTIAAVYATLPGNQDPARVGAWMLVGGAIVVVIAGLAGIRSPAVPVGVEPWTAWAHAVAMAVVVGPVVLLLGVVDIPHGYWFAMTLTVVLRPYGAETQSVARQRVVGTTLGAALALGLATVLPTGIALAVAVGLLVLVVANAVMGRYAQQVTFLTPFIVLIGSGGGTRRWPASGAGHAARRAPGGWDRTGALAGGPAPSADLIGDVQDCREVRGGAGARVWRPWS